MYDEEYTREDKKEAVKTSKVVKWVVAGLIGFFLIVTAFAMFENVQEGERGVITRLGKVVWIAQPGMTTIIPFVYDIEPMSVRTTKLTVDSTASSKDLQDVTAQLAVQYNIIPTDENIIKTYSEFKSEDSIENIIIAPSIQEAIKSATAKYTAVELITLRQDVKKEIFETLKTRMEQEGVIVSNVDIIDFKFSASFNQSIEAKVKAEQDALTAQNDLARVEFESQQAISRAKAESEKTRLEVEALRLGGDDIILKIKAEAQLEMAKKWNGVLPTQMIPGGAVPFLDLKY